MAGQSRWICSKRPPPLRLCRSHHSETRAGRRDLRQDRGGRCWLAMALAVPHRLWLGGVVSPVRDLGLIQRLVDLGRLAWKPGRTLLICVDGLASYVTAFWRASREKVHTGRRGRPPYRLPRGLLLGQVIKKHSGRRLAEVIRHAVWGGLGRINGVLHWTGTGRQINTSDIERLNATFRSRRAALIRWGRGLAHEVATLETGMYLVGCVYNFCTGHRSLRVAVAGARPSGRNARLQWPWVGQTMSGPCRNCSRSSRQASFTIEWVLPLFRTGLGFCIVMGGRR